MNALSHFLSMGGYAAYVWPAFGLTACVLIYQWLKAYLAYRTLLKQWPAKIDPTHAPSS